MLVGLNLPCGEGKHDDHDHIKMLGTFRVCNSGVSLSGGRDVECDWNVIGNGFGLRSMTC